MQWRELESEIKLETLGDALRAIDCLSAINIVSNLWQGIKVYALRSCVETVMSHVRSDRKEVGGLLLGRVYQFDPITRVSAGSMTILTEAVSSSEYRNSAVSLEMGTEVWSRVGQLLSALRVVVGWYHSHPNLGAFFSGTDRRTQRAFFNHHYSLGWVIDPLRDDQKIFCGGDSEEYRFPLQVLDYGLEMAKNI
jgi:proteasome lid subunit RPN8/RPN11